MSAFNNNEKEDIVGKGEDAGSWNFLSLPHYSLPYKRAEAHLYLFF